MTDQQIFDRIVTIIQERQGEDFVVTENLSLKDDLDGGSVMAGQIAGLVSKEETVEEILKDIYYGAAEKIQSEAARWAGVTRND